MELDASLIEDLETVGLVTESGTVKVKDLTSYQISLASSNGDITCQGILDGNIKAELGNDGNFFGHSIVSFLIVLLQALVLAGEHKLLRT